MHLDLRHAISSVLRTQGCVLESQWVANGIFVLGFMSCLLFSFDGGYLAVTWRFVP